MMAFESSEISSAKLAEGVAAARRFRSWREDRDEAAGLRAKGCGSLLKSGKGSLADLLRQCRLRAGSKELLEEMGNAYALSGRGIAKVLSVARTIADLAEKEVVDDECLLEALSYRCRQA